MVQHFQYGWQKLRIRANLCSFFHNYVNKYAQIRESWEKDQAIYCTGEAEGTWNLIGNGIFTQRGETLSRPLFPWAGSSDFTKGDQWLLFFLV